MERLKEELLGLIPEKDREHAANIVDSIIASTAEKPAEFFIGVDEVEKRHRLTESAEMLECRKNMMFHQPYYRVIANPGGAADGTSLYQAMKWWCDWQDRRQYERDKDAVRKNDTVASLIELILTLPMEAFGDADYLLDLGMAIIKEKNKYYKRIEVLASSLGKIPEGKKEEELNAAYVDGLNTLGTVITAAQTINDLKANEAE